jgi:type I restriction enzyme S subunit
MKKLLPEVCTIQYGFPFDSAKFSDSDGMPLIRIRDVVRGYSETYTTEEYKSEYIVHENDLLIGMDGEFNIAKWGKTPALLNQRVCRLAPKDSIDKDYLFYFMPIALKRIEEKTPFVTVKHLSAKELNKIEIPVLPLEEQRKIAETLSKVDELIAFRDQQLAKLDELVKARFVEMFGESEYPRNSLISLIIEGAGLSYGIVQPGDDGTGDMGVLRPVDFADGKIKTDSIKYIDRSLGDGFKKTELNGNELLITVRGTTGITALTDSRFKGMNVTRGIAVIRYDKKKVDSIYLNEYIKMEKSQQYIKEHTRGATLQQINLSELRDLEIVIPPLPLQRVFATFVEHVDQQKQTVQQSLEKLELLKKALMQEYFG